MNSRLERITDWRQLARDASYKPASMAALAPASLRQLERYFYKTFGKTPRDWARQLQCEKARELIRLGYSNKATASELGFTNEAEFCRIFKKVFGFPPQHFGPIYQLSSAHKNVVHSQSI